MTLGRAVFDARAKAGLTVRALAKRLECSAPFVSDVEHDRRTPGDIAKWELALGLDDGVLKALDPRVVHRSDLNELNDRVARLETLVRELARSVAMARSETRRY